MKEIETGDWVRFQVDRRLIIAQVEYIGESVTGKKIIYTDQGEATNILECRSKESNS